MTSSDPIRVVILRSDRLVGDLIRRQILEIWPNAIVRVFQLGMDALTAIQDATPDLFISDVWIEDMDGLEHLEHFTDTTLPILVVTTGLDVRTGQMLRQIRYDSLYDALSEGLDQLPAVLRQTMEHQSYVSPSFQPFLKLKRSITVDELTPMEELVLSVIGDGSDNLRAADRLNMSPRTVSTHRDSIMRKLGFHHKGELMIHALQHGFIRVTVRGVYHPGYQRRIFQKAKPSLVGTAESSGSQKRGFRPLG